MRRQLALALSLVLAAAACTSEAASPPPQTGAPTQAPGATATPGTGSGECPASAQGQAIEMWSPLTGPDGDEMTELAERYSAENGMGITVTHTAQPEYVQKLEAAAAAKQLPALTVVRVVNVGQLAARGVLKPWEGDALAALGDIETDFPENVWSQGEFRDARYSIPLDVHPLVMYYNKELFQAAGVPEPGTTAMTREQWDDALAKLEASGVIPVSVGTAFIGATLFQSLIVQFGGSLASEDGTKVTYNSDAGVRALQYVHELRQKYTPDVSGGGDPEVQVFKQKQAAIVIHGPWWISDLQKLDFVGFAPFPQIGDQHAVWGGSHQLALTTDDAAKQAAAGCWVKWLSDNSAGWAAAGQVPARNSIRNDPNLASVAAPIAAIAPTADKAIILPQVPALEPALWDKFGPAVDAVLLGEVTDIKAALDQAAAESQAIVDDNAQRFAP